MIKKLLILLALIAVAIGVMAGPAAAATNFQVPSNGSTTAIVSGGAAYNSTTEGCHTTAAYSPNRVGSVSPKVVIPKHVTFCIALGIDNDDNGNNTATDYPVVGLKWRCYDDTGSTAVTCDNFRATVKLYIDASHIYSFAFGCDAGGGPLGQCKGYAGSGTFTNNPGWQYPSGFAGFTVFRGANDLMAAYRAYTTDETVNGNAVGGASTDSYHVTDTF